MGWANCGEDSKGRPIGYAHQGTCDHPGGCAEQLDRSLAYACGGMHGTDERSCEGYFCSDHRVVVTIDDEAVSLCFACAGRQVDAKQATSGQEKKKMKIVKYQVGPDGKVVTRDIELFGGMQELAQITQFFLLEHGNYPLLPDGIQRLSVEWARPGAKYNPCVVVTVLLEEGQVAEQVETEVRACLAKILTPLAPARVERMKEAGVI